MAVIDLFCRESFSLAGGASRTAVTADRLYIGGGWRTYLFFEIPPSVWLSRLLGARLVLFKLPARVPPWPPGSCYTACPLLDFMSPFSPLYAPPEVDPALCFPYEDDECSGYTQIDITGIVTAWVKTAPENKGLLLSGEPDARLWVYASGRHCMAGVRPLLRLTLEGVSAQLCAAPCSVKVN